MFKFLVLIMAIALITIGIKVVPPFVDNWTVSSILKEVGKNKDIESMDDADIREAFSKRFSINAVDNISMDQIVINREGKLIIDINYEVRTNVFRNIDAVISFKNRFDSAHP